jgi:hypothetical protein
MNTHNENCAIIARFVINSRTLQAWCLEAYETKERRTEQDRENHRQANQERRERVRKERRVA